MPRRKKARADWEVLEDLAELGHELNLPGGALDGDIEDVCNDEARLMSNRAKGLVLLGQLEFLHRHGYDLGRLRARIEEAAKGE